MSAIAARYIAAIRTVQPKGPYRLMGYSAGGVIVYAMAEALLAQGESVEFLGIIDSRADLGVLPEVLAAVEYSDQAEREHGPELADAIFLRHALKNEIPSQAKSEFSRALEQGDLKSIFGVMDRHRLKLNPDLAAADLATVRRAIRVMRSTQKALCHYRPSQLPITLTLFVATANKTEDDLTSGWKRVASRLRTVPIGGSHLSMMESPHIDVLGRAIANALGDRPDQSTHAGQLAYQVTAP
jgi:syringomycin synthetase protein SyrE